MRYWISGILGMLLGGLMLLNQLLQGMPQGSGGYLAGQLTAIGLGIALLVVGICYIREAMSGR